MATVINTTPAQSESSGLGFLLGVMLLIAFMIALFYYGGPLVRSLVPRSNTISVPDQIDVNVNSNQPAQPAQPGQPTQ